MDDKLNKFFIGIIPVLILGLSFGYSAFPICIAVLFARLLTSEKQTAGIFLLMYGGVIGGAIRMMYPFIPIYGLMLNVIGILLLRNLLVDLVTKDKKSIVFLFITFFVFAICYNYGPKTAFAETKLNKLIETGLFTILGYYSLLKSDKYSAVKLFHLLILSSIAIMSFDIAFYHMTPGSIFDFDWFRNQEMTYFYANNHEGYMLSYQEIGMLSLFAIAIYLSQKDLDNRKQVYYYIACAALLIMLSSARQAIVGLFAVIVLRMSVFNRKNLLAETKVGKLLFSLISLVVLTFITIQVLPLLNISVINSLFHSGDEGRTMLYVEALNMFSNNQLFGLGFGGFEHYTMSDQPWPHNFFLEVLCECGLFGAFTFLTLIVSYLIMSHTKLLEMTRLDMFYFLIVSAIFIRCMVSSDFRESIELFSAIFAVSSLTKTELK